MPRIRPSRRGTSPAPILLRNPESNTRYRRASRANLASHPLQPTSSAHCLPSCPAQNSARALPRIGEIRMSSHRGPSVDFPPGRAGAA